MSLKGVIIKEGKIGANIAGDSREFGIVGNGVAVEGKLELDKVYTLRRPSDAAALGIDERYDEENDVRIYRHISEFYRRAGEGNILHVVLTGAGVAPANMVDAGKAMVLASTNIADIAFAFSPGENYEDTQVDGLNADIKAAIPVLQAFADWCDSSNMPVHVILEGRGISDTVSSLANLRDLQVNGNTLSAHKVTLVVGQDWNYAEGLSDIGKKFADVGTFLGCIASQAWNRNPGEFESQMLTDTVLDIFTIGGLSNHKKYTEVYADLETMDEKGYVFPIRYEGVSGYWWNDGHVCAPIILDKSGSMNQHTIYYSHTMDMSKRALRITFLPEVKKPVELENGKLPQGKIGYYNAIGDQTFEAMAGKSLISDGRTTVDPDSDLLIEKKLKVGFAVVPTGMTNVIEGSINLKKS